MPNHSRFGYQSAIDSDVILQLLLSYLYIRKSSLILIHNRILIIRIQNN